MAINVSSGLSISKERVVTVAKSGGQFNTIQAAIDYAYAAWGPVTDFANTIVVRVAPGIYEERIFSYAGIYISGEITGWDPPGGRAPATLYNTGADADHYVFDPTDGNRVYMMGMNIQTDNNGVFGELIRGQFTNCSFREGHFIEAPLTGWPNVRFDNCIFDKSTYGGFKLEGVGTADEWWIDLVDCYLYGIPTFTSTHAGSGTIALVRSYIKGNLNIGGNWSLISEDISTYGKSNRNTFGTSGSIKIYRGFCVNGVHFTAAPSSLEVGYLSFIGGEANKIPAGEGDITSDVILANVAYANNTQHNGLDGKVQIASKVKNVGNGLPDSYRNLQEALDSCWEDHSFVELGTNVVMAASIVPPGFSVTVDGQRAYGIHSDATPHLEVAAGKNITFSRLSYLTGGEIVLNGNAARLVLTHCGKHMDHSGESVTVRFRMAAGDATTHLHLIQCNCEGGSAFHNCIKIDHASPIVFVDRTTMRGYTGHPAVHMTIQTIGTWRSKYSTMMHGTPGAANFWLVADVAGTEVRSYEDSFCMGSMHPADLVTNVANQISGAKNASDLDITY